MRESVSFAMPSTGPERLLVCLLICSLALGGCASLPDVSTEVSYCCQPDAASISSFRIEFSGMPEFLKPMLRDEVSIVLDAKGLEYTEGDAQAILGMTFVNTPLESAEPEGGDAWGALSPGGAARFNAVVHVELKESVTKELVLAGTLSRLHYAPTGSYMHEAPARAAMREALTVLFAGFPDARLEDD